MEILEIKNGLGSKWFLKLISEHTVLRESESPEFVRSSFIDSGVGLLRIDKKETERNRDQEMLVSSLQPDLEFFHQFFS